MTSEIRNIKTAIRSCNDLAFIETTDRNWFVVFSDKDIVKVILFFDKGKTSYMISEDYDIKVRDIIRKRKIIRPNSNASYHIEEISIPETVWRLRTSSEKTHYLLIIDNTHAFLLHQKKGGGYFTEVVKIIDSGARDIILKGGDTKMRKLSPTQKTKELYDRAKFHPEYLLTNYTIARLERLHPEVTFQIINCALYNNKDGMTSDIVEVTKGVTPREFLRECF